MGDALTELRITIRGLLKRPAYALLAVLTIVLGVGAVTAAYGLLHEVVLRPLPYGEPDRLVSVRSRFGSDLFGITHAEYLHLQQNAAGFEGMAALREPALDRSWIRTDGETPEVLNAVAVTPEFFRTLGVVPALGAGFDGEPGAGPQVVLSHSYWRGRFGADRAAVGEAIEIDGLPYAVAGVLPAPFVYPLGGEPAEVWIMLRLEPTAASASDPLAYRVIGRLEPQASLATAREGVVRTLDRFRVGVPGSLAVENVRVRALKEDLVGTARRPLGLLLLGSGLVLLVGALNLSLLFVARNVDRRAELRVRSALGASRALILRQLLGEAGVLALAGGAVAVALASWVVATVFETGVGGLQPLSGGGVGPVILLFGVLAAVLPALAAAAVPGLRIAASIGGPGERSASPGPGRRRLAGVLSGVEAGMVFVLLAVAGLVLGSLREVTRVEPGFETVSTLAMELYLPEGEYQTLEELGTFLQLMEERVEGIPGVEAAGTISNLPLSPASWAGSFAIEGRADMDPDALPTVDWEVAGPGYFDAAGIPVVRGRAFTAEDRSDAARVALVNETLARRWWPGTDPLGSRISGNGTAGPWRTVVGVVGDVKQQGLAEETRGFMYVPALQAFPFGRRQLVVRSAGVEPLALVPSLRAAVREIDPDVTIGDVRPMRDLVRGSSGAFRLRAVLFGLFGAMALLLGIAGIYGVAAHGVRAQRRAIGIRMAVGADGRTIQRAVLREGLLPVLAGVASGLALVLAAGPALDGLLFGVRPAEPAVLVIVGGVLLAAAAGAIVPTALRARNVDPARLLREE